MYPVNSEAGSTAAGLFLLVVLLMAVAGCGGGPTDRAPTFEDAGVADKTYDQNLPIDRETLPTASGGDGALTYAI